MPVLLSAVSLVSATIPARADETNEPKQASKPEKKMFFFNGGGPHDFILAMDKHFRTRLMQILSIPSSLARAEVPKMRIATDKPEDALQVYNHLQDPTLGQWKYAGPSSDPSVLALVPDRELALSKATTGAKVKAMALGGIPETRWKDFEKDVLTARQLGVETAEKFGGGDKYEGYIRIQPESKILIVSGSEGYIQMVESVLAAYRANAQTDSNKAVPTKP